MDPILRRGQTVTPQTARALQQTPARFAARYARIARFGVVGVLGSAAYVLSIVFLVEIAALPVLWAACLAFALVVAQNYVLHYGWTFNSDQAHGIALPKFAIMSAAGFALNSVIMFTGVTLGGFDYRWVQPVAIATIVLWNYFASVLWVFKHAVRLASK